LAHRPALDGLRGLAVVAVLLFHLGYPWAKGGFLGVSIFFTLSGFLITTLLVGEGRSQGRIDLRRFWSRRARRLLPAALLGLVVAVAVSRTLVQTPGGNQLDLLAALFDAANWRFLAAGQSYGALFTSPSPVLHYWSLAIEEQFYLLYPLAFAALFRRRVSPGALLAWLLGGIAASWVALAGAGIAGAHDIAYYSTPTRAGELLTGGVAAVLFATRGRRQLSIGPAGPRVRSVVEVVSLIALVVLCASVTSTSASLERGVLPVVAILSAVVVLGACRGGALSSVLGWRPLTDLGRISYGVYVFHWPILLWLSPARTGLDGIALTALRLAVTLAAAIASFVLVERPIRAGRWPKPQWSLRIAPAAVLSAAAVVLLLGAPTTATDFDAIQAHQAALSTPRALGAAGADPARALVATPGAALATPRLAMFGDSTALMTGLGIARWGHDSGRLQLVGGVTPLGCSITRGGERRYQGGQGPTVPECDTWPDRWAGFLAENPADIAAVLVGPWEVGDRRRADSDRWEHIGEPAYDAFVVQELSAAADLLLDRVPTVVWLTSPDIQSDRVLVNPPSVYLPENDPERMARFNELVREVAATRPNLHVVDLNAPLRSLPGGELDAHLRPDGIHFTNDSTNEIAPWLGESILAAAGAS